MALLANTAEGGSDGTGVTTGNSGGTSGNAWSAVTLPGATTAVYDDDAPLKGAISIILNSPGDNGHLQWNTTAANQCVARFYIYINQLPAGNTVCLFSFQTSTTRRAGLNLSTAGLLSIVPSNNSTLASSAANVATGTLYRIEASFDNSGGASAGAMIVNTYLGDSTSAVSNLSVSISGTNFGTDTVDNFRLGRTAGVGPGASITAFNVTLDDIAFQDSTLTLLGPSGGGATDLVVSDLTVTVVADAPTLTQVHNLAVADATVTVTADTPTLTQVHQLAVADLAVTATADTVTLTQVHSLVVADLVVVVAADAPTLTQVHELVVVDATVITTADTVTLDVGAITLSVDDLAVAVAADTVTLTQVHALVVADAVVATTIDTVALTQVHELVVADLAVEVVIDTPTIVVGGITLAVADLAVGTTIDAVTLTQTHVLSVADLAVTTTADTVTLTQAHVLAVSDLTITVAMDTVTLTEGDPGPFPVGHITVTVSTVDAAVTVTTVQPAVTVTPIGAP